MKSILLLALLLPVPLSTSAQDPAGPPVPAGSPRRVVMPPDANQSTVLRPQAIPGIESGASARVAFRGLSQNVTLTIKGVLQGLVHVDLELTGCGPEFLTDYHTPAEPDSELPAPVMTVRVTLVETDDGYHAEYSLGARIAQVSSRQQSPGSGGAVNIEFRDLILKGAARVKSGEPVAVSKIGGKTLELKVTEVAQP
jgi:hypothetical protein